MRLPFHLATTPVTCSSRKLSFMNDTFKNVSKFQSVRVAAHIHVLLICVCVCAYLLLYILKKAPSLVSKRSESFSAASIQPSATPCYA